MESEVRYVKTLGSLAIVSKGSGMLCIAFQKASLEALRQTISYEDDRVCDQIVPGMRFKRQGKPDWKRDQSGSDIVGTCKGTRNMQERGSCLVIHLVDTQKKYGESLEDASEFSTKMRRRSDRGGQFIKY